MRDAYGDAQFWGLTPEQTLHHLDRVAFAYLRASADRIDELEEQERRAGQWRLAAAAVCVASLVYAIVRAVGVL